MPPPMFRTVARLSRLIRAGLVLARHDVLLPREYQDLLPWPARLLGRVLRLFALPAGKGGPGARMARALERLGPTYVKLGQLLSTRADIIGAEFAEGLATLKDKAAPFSQTKAIATIETELGGPVSSWFANIDPPAAAASLAQAHRAKTTDGRDVAVKVLRPGIEERVARDLDAMSFGARMVERIAPSARRLEPVAFVNTLTDASTKELDLRLEAGAAGELADVAIDIDGYQVAAVDWDLSARRVLTTEWIDGAPLSNDTALDAIGADRSSLAVTLIQAFLTSALDHGVFHADLHEGNLFALQDGTLVAIDFGLVGRIGPGERRYLAEILHGFLQRDYARIAQVHFDAGYVPANHATEEFALALRAVGEPIFGKIASEVSMARLLLQLFEVTERFDMHLRPELVLLQKTMVQAEGVSRRLDPDFDMWGAAQPVVARWMARELGPEGIAKSVVSDLSRLRTALQRLPTALENLSEAAEAAAAGHMSLDDASLVRLAKAQRKASRPRTLALWVLALSAATLAIAASVSVFG